MAGNRDEYRVPRAYGEDEYIVNKSCFIGRVWPVSTEKEALAILRRTRELHRDASHNVYCYRLRAEGLMRYSDDGEPSGTAGLPLLECFLRQDIHDFLCISTRWFGGILLGAGGLVRAYARSGAGALEAAGIAVMRMWSTGLLVCPYPMYDRLGHGLAALGAIVEDTAFGADVSVQVALPSDDWESFRAGVVDFSSGEIEPVLIEEKYSAR